MTDLVFDSVQRGVVYASTVENGVFKSLDSGATWSPVNQGFWSYHPIEKLAWSPAAPSMLYAVDTYGRLYRSIAGGRWEALWQTTRWGIYFLAADPARGGVLWAYCAEDLIPSAICRSPDGGSTWERRYELRSGISGFAFDPRRPSLIYVALQNESGRRLGILRSNDEGSTWKSIRRGLPLGQGTEPVRTAVTVAPDTGDVYASIWKPGSQMVFRSADQGQTWIPSGPGGYPIAAGPGGSVVTGSGARSLDGGDTWTLGGEIDAVTRCLAIDPFESHLALAGTDKRGVFRTASGQLHWSLSNQGLVATIPLALAADPRTSGTLYASVAGGGLFKTTRGGLEWEPVETGLRNASGLLDLAALVLDPSGGPTLYGIRQDWEQGNTLLRSRDGGRSWETLSVYPWQPTSHSLATNPATPGTLYATQIGDLCSVSRSLDWGEVWHCMDGGWANQSNQIVVDPSHPENLYALGARIRSSHDGGVTWGPASRGLETNEIACLEVAPSQSDILYVGTAGCGVRQSTDRGRTWHSASGDLSAFPGYASALALDPLDAKRVYAAIDGVVYFTLDGGRHWTPLGVKPAASLIGPLFLDPTDPGTLYAGSQGRGFYRIRLVR